MQVNALYLAACKADDDRGGALIARDEFEDRAKVALGNIWPDTILDAAR